MTLSTGAVSFDDIRTEFSMSGAISYAGCTGAVLTSEPKLLTTMAYLATSVPTSGEISIANLRQARG